MIMWTSRITEGNEQYQLFTDPFPFW